MTDQIREQITDVELMASDAGDKWIEVIDEQIINEADNTIDVSALTRHDAHTGPNF